ncbi:hypothetical protein HMPREF1549_02459, partial [Actinomyces johnsonii F0510]
AGAGASQACVARQARCAYAIRWEGRAAGVAGTVDVSGAFWEGGAAGGCEETAEDAGEGAFSGTSGGAVLDGADGMNTPQTVGDERLAADKDRLVPQGRGPPASGGDQKGSWDARRYRRGSGRRTGQPTFLSTS